MEVLEKYKEGQPIIYNLLMNSIKNNRVSHAYLFDTSDFQPEDDFALALSKTLLCPSSYMKKEKCKGCTICQRIESNNYSDVKIIEPGGLQIKKEQMLELKSEFSVKAIEGEKKVYIIKEADKLNKHAANSLLKFLEEPEEGIIALLFTKNIHQVLNTIISRCQVVSFKKPFNMGNNQNSMGIEKATDSNNKVVEFITFLELQGEEALLYTNELWHNHFKDKEQIYWGIQVMILFYKDVLNLTYGRDIEYFLEYKDKLKEVLEKNNVSKIINKINKLDEMKELIRNNINIGLLVDKIIIDLLEVK